MYQRLTLNGYNWDLPPGELPPDIWSSGRNMLPKPGGMIRARGYLATLGTPLCPPKYLLYTPQLGLPTWLYAGTKIVTIDGATHNDRTPAGFVAAAANNWTGGNLNGIAIINSLENPPYYWFAGQPTTLELPGQRPNTRYVTMRPFKYHLIWMGVLESNKEFFDEVHWSNAADPGQVPDTWVPAADNEAGDNILADEPGPIIDGLPMRDVFVMYKGNAVYEMSYIGGVSVFRFRKLYNCTGMLTRNCAVEVKGTHIVLGNGDIYRHDGQNITSIIDGVLKATFFGALDNENYQNSYVVYIEPDEEVWFCVPTSGETVPTRALVYGVNTGLWGFRDLPPTDFAAVGIVVNTENQGLEAWDTDADAWDSDTTIWLQQSLDATQEAVLLASATNTKLYKGNAGATNDGAPYTSSLERLGLSLDDPVREKAIRRIWPRITAPQGAQFTLALYNQRDPTSGYEEIANRTFTTGGPDGVAVNGNARYLGFRIYTDESVDWQLAGFDVEYMPMGLF